MLIKRLYKFYLMKALNFNFIYIHKQNKHDRAINTASRQNSSNFKIYSCFPSLSSALAR